MDLSDDRVFLNGTPHDYFRMLRRHEPVCWNASRFSESFWSVTRHDDIQYVSSNPQVFSSVAGPFTIGIDQGYIKDSSAVISLDPPRHTPVRQALLKLLRAGWIDEVVREAIDRAMGEASGRFDFVDRVSGRIPRLVVSRLLGVDIETLADRVLVILLEEPATVNNRRRLMTQLGLLWKRLEHGHERSPFASALLEARAGAASTHDRVNNLLLFLLAGYETTKNVLSDAMALYLKAPQLLLNAPSEQALAKEILRFFGPVRHMCRRVRCETELGGHTLLSGELVTLWYCSANFDGTRFPEPLRFDPDRGHNPHLSFGTGVHTCLGAGLAMLELVEFLKFLGSEDRRWESAGDSVRRSTSFVNALRCLPVEVSA